jgi:hypothetical protein
MTQATQAAQTAPAQLNDISKQWIDWLTQGGAQAFATIINKPEETACKDALNRIPRFDHEDHPELSCLYMGFEASRFEEGQIQLCLYMYDRVNQRGGWWTGPLSQQYCRGNDADKTYFQKTLMQLERAGVTISNKNAVDWLDVLRQIFGKTIPCWVAEKETKDGGRKYYIVQSLGASDFSAPAPIAWPTAGMGMMPTQSTVIPQPQAMPAQPSAFAAPTAPMAPAAPAAPAAPKVTVADIPQTAQQPQAGRVPQANPFFKPQA